MTDTERLVAALERKAALAEADAVAANARLSRDYSPVHSLAKRDAEARAEAFREAAAMARHPSMLSHPRPAAVR